MTSLHVEFDKILSIIENFTVNVHITYYAHNYYLLCS